MPILWLPVLSSPARAQCADPLPLIDVLEQAAASGRHGEAAARSSEVVEAFGCGPPADPALVARLWLAEAILLRAEGELASSDDALLAAARISTGIWVEDYGAELRARQLELHLEATEPPAVGTLSLEPALGPDHVAAIDGILQESFPASLPAGPHLVQVGSDPQHMALARVVELLPSTELVVRTGLPGPPSPVEPRPTEPPAQADAPSSPPDDRWTDPDQQQRYAQERLLREPTAADAPEPWIVREGAGSALTTPDVLHRLDAPQLSRRFYSRQALDQLLASGLGLVAVTGWSVGLLAAADSLAVEADETIAAVGLGGGTVAAGLVFVPLLRQGRRAKRPSRFFEADELDAQLQAYNARIAAEILESEPQPAPPPAPQPTAPAPEPAETQQARLQRLEEAQATYDRDELLREDPPAGLQGPPRDWIVRQQWNSAPLTTPEILSLVQDQATSRRYQSKQSLDTAAAVGAGTLLLIDTPITLIAAAAIADDGELRVGRVTAIGAYAGLAAATIAPLISQSRRKNRPDRFFDEVRLDSHIEARNAELRQELGL